MGVRALGVRALLAASAFLLLLQTSASEEDKISCKAIWVFKVACTEPSQALVNQVNVWNSQKDCDDDQERCMYQVVKVSPTYLEIKHTSRRTSKTTLIEFGFIKSTTPFCKMRGIATSSQKVPVPNEYCLLFNLINGSGLTNAPGYKEICHSSMCPPKDSASC